MWETAIVWTTSLKLEQYASQTGNLEIKGGPPPVIVHKLRQAMCLHTNVTLRRLRVSTVAVEKQ